MQKGPETGVTVLGLALLLHKVLDSIEQFLHVFVATNTLGRFVFSQQLHQAARAGNVFHGSERVLLRGDNAVRVNQIGECHEPFCSGAINSQIPGVRVPYCFPKRNLSVVRRNRQPCNGRVANSAPR